MCAEFPFLHFYPARVLFEHAASQVDSEIHLFSVRLLRKKTAACLLEIIVRLFQILSCENVTLVLSADANPCPFPHAINVMNTTGCCRCQISRVLPQINLAV